MDLPDDDLVCRLNIKLTDLKKNKVDIVGSIKLIEIKVKQ